MTSNIVHFGSVSWRIRLLLSNKCTCMLKCTWSAHNNLLSWLKSLFVIVLCDSAPSLRFPFTHIPMQHEWALNNVYRGHQGASKGYQSTRQTNTFVNHVMRAEIKITFCPLYSSGIWYNFRRWDWFLSNICLTSHFKSCHFTHHLI